MKPAAAALKAEAIKLWALGFKRADIVRRLSTSRGLSRAQVYRLLRQSEDRQRAKDAT